MASPVDPDLVRGWLAARSLSRGLPQPVADHGGWRVDSGQPDELRRYLFAEAGAGLHTLATTIDTPLVFLKLCARTDVLRALLPPRWHVLPATWMMVRDTVPPAPSPAPPGYHIALSGSNGVTHVRVTTDAGDLAASGYAAEHDGAFAYDRIVTAQAHRRRGLGTLVMTALGATRRSTQSRQALTATDAGRALYESMGWRLYTPYASAVIPAPQ